MQRGCSRVLRWPEPSGGQMSPTVLQHPQSGTFAARWQSVDKGSFTARDGWMMLGRTQDILQFLIQLELNGVEKLWLVPADLWWSPGGGWKCTLAGIGTARERLGSWIIEVCLVIYHSDGWVVPLTTCWSWYIYMKYGKIEIPLTKYT